MKVVFFVHYFPPLNSTGSRRVESFAKYLARDGHDVVVVSTRKTLRDGPLTEPVPAYVRLYEIDWSGRLLESDRSTTPAAPVAGTAKRIHWTRQVKQKLMRLCGQALDHRLAFAFALRSRQLDAKVVEELSTADVFVSSCPPWPAHLAALFARRRFGKPWIADYRDQFSGNHVMNGTWLSDKIELWIDRALLKRATAVTVISGPMQTYYEAMHSLVECVENGYDSEIFERIKGELLAKPRNDPSQPAVLRYMGTITRDRIPRNLLAALEKVVAEPNAGNRHVQLEFYGDTRILEDHVNTHHAGLKPWMKFLPAVPYVKSIEAMLTADALLFIETSDLSSLSARGVLTTKLFEYLASGRQILAEIDDATLAASYIRRASSLHVVSRDVDTFVTALRQIGADQPADTNELFVSSLSRKEKAREFERIALQLTRPQPQHHESWKDCSEHSCTPFWGPSSSRWPLSPSTASARGRAACRCAQRPQAKWP
jgi:glycosyltransferase involved in cell wall biosynthesis